MKPGKASWTAQITAIYRAVESLRPADQRICDDPFAKHFLDLPFRLILKSRPLTRFALWLGVERRFPGGVDTILSRVRFVDDCLAAALEDGTGQVVLLGAGFDARAHRFGPLLNGRTVFEVDHPATQAVKKRKVRQFLGQAPRHVTYVGVDFEKQSFMERLLLNGFDTGVKSFFIWEGVAKYLTPHAARQVLEAIARSVCKGSAVVFDYLLTTMLHGCEVGKMGRRILAYQKKKGEPFLFGLEKGKEHETLMDLGFSRVDCTTPRQLRQKYFKGTSRAARMHTQWGIALAVV